MASTGALCKQLPVYFPLPVYGLMLHRKVPAECFEHLHLVSLLCREPICEQHIP